MIGVFAIPLFCTKSTQEGIVIVPDVNLTSIYTTTIKISCSTDMYELNVPRDVILDAVIPLANVVPSSGTSVGSETSSPS